MSLKILIADDEPNQLELLSFNLSQAGFEVARAHDGEQALTMIEDSLPDLVVLDWICHIYRGLSYAAFCARAGIQNYCPLSC